MVRKWASSINKSLYLHNYLTDISGVHSFPSKLTLLIWRGEKNTDVFCLCAAVGSQLQILFINPFVCRHPKRSLKGLKELKFWESLWWYHSSPPLWEHWARLAQLTGAAVGTTTDPVWPSTLIWQDSGVKDSNTKKLHRAETNKTIHALKCIFLTLVCCLRIVSWASVGCLWSEDFGEGTIYRMPVQGTQIPELRAKHF